MYGAAVKIELVDGSGAVLQVQIGREQHEQLELRPGERIYVTPRRVRVFTSD